MSVNFHAKLVKCLHEQDIPMLLGLCNDGRGLANTIEGMDVTNATTTANTILKAIYVHARLRYSTIASILFQTLATRRTWFMSAQTYQADVYEITTAIFEARQQLRVLVEGQEQIIQYRWKNKNKNNRKKILSAAWKEMPTEHRADVRMIRAGELSWPLKNRDSFLSPHLTQDDLCKGDNLVALIKSRASTPPHVFAWSDAESMRPALKYGAGKSPRLPDYSMMLAEGDPVNYGLLVSWRGKTDAQLTSIAEISFEPCVGYEVLLLQKRMLMLAVDCAKGLLHDFVAGGFPTISIDTAKVSAYTSTAPSTGLPSIPLSLEQMAAIAPYFPPAVMDLRAILDLARARLSSAEARVMTIRENPAYLLQQIEVFASHNGSVNLDGAGKARLETIDKHKAEQIMILVVDYAYSDFATWHTACDDLQSLAKAAKEADPPISPTRLPSEEYLMLVLHFRTRIEQDIKRLRPRFGSVVRGSPGLRDLYTRKIIPYYEHSIVERVGGHDHLASVLEDIEGARGQQAILSLREAVDELERLLIDPKTRKKLSKPVMDIASDLRMLGHLQQMLIPYPWHVAMDHMVKTSGIVAGELCKSLTKTRQHVYDLHKAVEDIRPNDLAYLVLAPRENFAYPQPKTKQTTDVRRASEELLDYNWAIIDRYVLRKTGQSLQKGFHALFASDTDLERTPVWTDPVPEQVPANSATTLFPETGQSLPVHPYTPQGQPLEESSPSDPSSIPKALHQVQHVDDALDDTRDMLQSLITDSTVASGFMRDPPNSVEGDVEVEMEDEEEEEEVYHGYQPYIPAPIHGNDNERTSADVDFFIVKHSTWLAMCAILYTKGMKSCSRPKTTWSKVKLVMLDIGFKCVPWTGSMWKFLPCPELGLHRSILIHDPHEGEVTKRTANDYRDRFYESYHWTMDNFRVGKVQR